MVSDPLPACRPACRAVPSTGKTGAAGALKHAPQREPTQMSSDSARAHIQRPHPTTGLSNHQVTHNPDSNQTPSPTARTSPTCESGPGSFSRSGSCRRPPSLTMVTTCQGLVAPQGSSQVSSSHRTTLHRRESREIKGGAAWLVCAHSKTCDVHGGCARERGGRAARWKRALL
jgi:hypothetical protein